MVGGKYDISLSFAWNISTAIVSSTVDLVEQLCIM